MLRGPPIFGIWVEVESEGLPSEPRPSAIHACDGELKRPSRGMSELDPDDYAERLKHLEQGHDILAAWILMLLVAILFISLGSFLGGAEHVVWAGRIVTMSSNGSIAGVAGGSLCSSSKIAWIAWSI